MTNKQSIFFVVGSLVAVVLLVVGLTSVSNDQDNTGIQIPFVTSSHTTCYRLGAPVHDASLITAFSIDGSVLPFDYPLPFTALIVKLDEMGYIVSYTDKSTSDKKQLTALHLTDVPEGTYHIKRKNADSTAGSATFKQQPCE